MMGPGLCSYRFMYVNRETRIDIFEDIMAINNFVDMEMVKSISILDIFRRKI